MKHNDANDDYSEFEFDIIQSTVGRSLTDTDVRVDSDGN